MVHMINRHHLAGQRPVGHLSLMNDFGSGQPTQYQDLHDDLKSLKELPETTSNERKLPTPGEDAQFSRYLRSRLPMALAITTTEE